MPRKEQSLIEEMRAAMARDRERVRSGSPVAAGPAERVEQEEPESEPPRRSLVDRLLRRET